MVLIHRRTGETPLHYAARKGSKEIVKILLEKGADTTVMCQDGSVSEIASNSGFKDIVALVESFAAKKRKSQKPYKFNLFNTGIKGNEDTLKELIYDIEIGKSILSSHLIT